MNSRTLTAKILIQVLPLTRRSGFNGRSLGDALTHTLRDYPDADRSLIQAMCYDTCRHYTRLDQLAATRLTHPLKPKDADIQCLLLIGLLQLFYLRVPDHASISETVEAARELGKPWAVKLINGLLRSAQRERDAMEAQISTSDAVQSSHPKWLVDLLAAAWPEHYRDILDNNNKPGPMTLRVNSALHTREQYLSFLNQAGIKATSGTLSPNAIYLEQACDVNALPGFFTGHCSVQDEAAQLAAYLLDPQPQETILDACAAPGGKTTHILEYQPDLRSLTAVDCDQTRCERIKENLERVDVNAEIVCSDLETFCTQAEPEHFDRILLDVPCSATGVIRRHPDIKWLRKRSDIAALAATQLRLLAHAWSVLKPGGTLLYATCSLLPQENERVITQFLEQQADASSSPITLPIKGTTDTQAAHPPQLVGYGLQLLPGNCAHQPKPGTDGFYYARLHKKKVSPP